MEAIKVAAPEAAHDPFTLDIIKNALAAIADEMANTVARTARSFVVKEALDFSTALFNADGELIAQGHLPSAPHGRHAVCHRGGRAGLPRRHARGRRLRDERPLGREHAPSRRGVRQAGLHGRRPRRLRRGARPPDGHRRPGRGGQCERFDRDLPGGPSPSRRYVSTIPASRWRRSSGSSSAMSGCRTS